MSALEFAFCRGGIHLPKLNLWLDPHEPRMGPEKVFISHAHADHVEAHREVILSAPTAELMQARLGGERLEHVLPFGERRSFDGDFSLTLLAAGHIFGSAMSLLETGRGSLLYTGDFKLRRGLSAEPCDPSPARGVDALIMETTYGQPQYRFPPTDAVMRGVIRFCQEALDNDETPVLLGYSLGKSQEILCSLADARLPIVLHGTVFKLTKIYEQFGQCFPGYERYDAATARHKVLLCPPNAANSAMLRNLGRTRTAVLTGWAVDPNCRYRYQVDAAFPLSDHADYTDLIEFVKLVSPKKVYTLHGFAADFAQTLRDLGIEAQALSEAEQMGLRLALPAAPRPTLLAPAPPPPASSSTKANPPSAESFGSFAETCAVIGGTSAKLEKVRLLADYIRPLETVPLTRVVTWCTGAPFASSENKVLQLGWALLRDALCAIGRIDPAQLHQVYLKHSDLGETAFEMFEQAHPIGQNPDIAEIDAAFRGIHAARGPSAKLPLLIRALEKCSPLEARYFVKIITGDLRIGLKEGLVEEAIARAFERSAEEVRQANLLLGHIGETAELARRNELAGATLMPFRAVKFMLASPEETAAQVWERMHRPAPDGDGPRPASPAAEPVWLEDKYDGIRCQLHKVGPRVALYSRDLKEITRTFLELADDARAWPLDAILDGEILAMRGDEVLPFAELQKRLGRREPDLFMSGEVPIQFVAFDLLWLNGQSLLNQPLRLRRQQLEAARPPSALLRLARITEARSPADIEQAFADARGRSNEGLMIKDPDSAYTPGRRGLSWLKLKKAFATLDCVVVGAEYGHGKRKDVLSDYTFAVRDDGTGELKTIGKAYSGLTDLEIAALTRHFLGRVKRRRGRYHEVEPDTVLEIAFDRLQHSDRHSSGLAMRFPRIVRIRTDKSVKEIDTLATARRLVK